QRYPRWGSSCVGSRPVRRLQDWIGRWRADLYAVPCPSMSDEPEHPGLRGRGEEAIGDLAQALLENPVFSQAVTTALGAGERAVQAQRSAMGALNIASSAELERLGRRLRSLSDRLEAIE